MQPRFYFHSIVPPFTHLRLLRRNRFKAYLGPVYFKCVVDCILEAWMLLAEVCALGISKPNTSVTRLGDFFKFLAANCLTKVAETFW